MVNEKISLVVLSIFVAIFATEFITATTSLQCNGDAEKILTTTLIPNQSFYAIPPVPIAFNSTIQFWYDNFFTNNPWRFENVVPLTQDERQYLTNNSFNRFNFEAGTYELKIESGAWSRWSVNEMNTSYWGAGDRGGEQGITWESTASVVYNNGTNLILKRFGEKNLSRTATEAENASKGDSLIVNHAGGPMYIVVDDFPINDNRGNITIGVYKKCASRGKVVNLTDFKLENHVSDGYINIVCETNMSTNSVEPWIGRNEPFPGRDFIINWNEGVPFEDLPKPGHGFIIDWNRTKVNPNGTQTAVYKFFVNRNLSGTYHIGCWLDNMRNDNDLIKTSPYPAIGSIIRLFTFGIEIDSDRTTTLGDDKVDKKKQRYYEDYDVNTNDRTIYNDNIKDFVSLNDGAISNGNIDDINSAVSIYSTDTTNNASDSVKATNDANLWFIGMIVLGILVLLLIIIIVFALV